MITISFVKFLIKCPSVVVFTGQVFHNENKHTLIILNANNVLYRPAS